MGDSTYYHKLFREAIVKASVYDTFDKAISEFSKVHNVTLGQANSCICTHPITENCHVKSNVTGKELVIGNKCIENFFKQETKDRAATLLKLAKRKTKDCERCKRRFQKGDDHVLCGKCRLRWKKCIDYKEGNDTCKRLFYGIENWKVRCLPCWHKSRA